jgi:hypothetical protein
MKKTQQAGVPITLSIAVALFTFTASYLAGLWDRPSFEYADSLLSSNQEWTLVVATSRNNTIGPDIMRLLNSTRTAIKEVLPQGADLLKQGAQKYYSNQSSEDDEVKDLAIGLFWDNPKTTLHPRWAAGWAVDGVKMRKIQGQLKAMQSAADLKDNESLRVVRIGKDAKILKARVPWRHSLTPVLAPMMHWKRGFAKYEKEYCKDKESDESKESGPDSPVAMEVYGMNVPGTYDHIDMVVLMGDVTKQLWDDAWKGN